jgi:hypothetical protein
MEQLYKGHRIEVLAGLEDANWRVSLRIFGQEGATRTLVIFTMNKQFARYGGAAEAGIIAAKNWVDTKLRPFSKTNKLCAHSSRLREESRVIQQTLQRTIAASKTIVAESLALYLEIQSSRSSDGRPGEVGG